MLQSASETEASFADQQEQEEEQTDMFDKDSLDRLFEELRDEFELETDWEDIQHDAHLAVAYADAGVLDDQLGSLDSRIVDIVQRHNPG